MASKALVDKARERTAKRKPAKVEKWLDGKGPGEGKIAVIGGAGTLYLTQRKSGGSHPPYEEQVDCDHCGRSFTVCMLLEAQEGYAECPHCQTDLKVERVSYLVSTVSQR